jgi:hypothetical protein
MADDDLNYPEKAEGEEVSAKHSSVSVFIGTWNLHAQDPPSDLSDFIPKDVHDIYAIGTEECGQSMEIAIVYDDKSKWEKLLIEHFGPNYVPIQRITLNAIHLIIVVRQDLLQFITSICANNVATGIGNVIGNKGILFHIFTTIV